MTGLNVLISIQSRMGLGREFQRLGAAMEKALSPSVLGPERSGEEFNYEQCHAHLMHIKAPSCFSLYCAHA